MTSGYERGFKHTYPRASAHPLLVALVCCVCVCVCGVQVRDGSGDEEVLDRAGDAVQNLAAFIDYKKAHLPR